MKKNLGLLALLALLLTLTYFLQEKRTEREYAASLTQGKVFTQEVQELKLPNVEARKVEGKWRSGEQLLSHNTLKQLEKKLSQLTLVKEIEGEPKAFLEDPVVLKVDGVELAIGGLSLDKRSFYIARDGKVALAKLEGESELVSATEEELEEEKLKELRSLVTKDPEELRETQLFRYFSSLPPDRVKIASEGGLSYELLLKKNATDPAPIKGVSVHRELLNKFLSVFTQLTIKKELPYSEKLKVRRLGSMTFQSEDGKEQILLEAWLQGKNSADAVVIDESGKRAFSMVGGTMRPFFLQVQDYWDKKVIPPSSFRAFKRLSTTFTQGSREVRVTVIDREPLDFDAEGAKVRPGNMQDLFQLIFNLGPRDQASRVSQLSSSERQQYLSEENLRVSVMDQDLLCVRKKDELILVNLTQGFKAHFLTPFENLRCALEDVLELKGK